MSALRYVHVPGYAALILRRTYADLSLPGAIMDRALDWLRGKVDWSAQNKRFIFPSGATLTFGYLEHEKDKYRYQGSEYSFCAFDELTQFTETQYRYLLTRLRRLESSRVPLRMRCASNPGGVGHDWVKARFVDSVDPDRVFVPARLEDNPHLDQVSYRKALSLLDDTTRRQLEKGEWVRDGSTQLYRFDASRNLVLEYQEPKHPLHVIGVDLGASESKPSTAFVVMVAQSSSPVTTVVHSEVRAGMTEHTIALRLKELMTEYEPVDIVVDAGALGIGYVRDFQAQYGIPANAAEKRNKLGYRKALNAELERGHVMVWDATNADLIEELQTVRWDEKGLDAEKGAAIHLSDALLYAWRAVRALSGEQPKPLLQPGTPAYYEAEAEDMEREEDEHVEKAWWEQ